ncbi:MAG: hypothetical protein AAGA58_02020 [Verrucomicrobiota bacterium]
MNSLSYTVLRIARSIGIGDRHHHLRVARREATFVSEAEQLLGQSAWRDAEHIEELAEEYWNLVEIENQQEKLREEILAFEDENRRLSDEHDRLEEDLEIRVQDLIDKKTEKMQKALGAMHELDSLRSRAEFTRKRYNGLNTKFKVLNDQGVNEEELATVRAELEELQKRFAEETHLIEERTKLIHGHENEALNVDDEISELRDDAKGRISAMMTEVGKSSNLVARHSARIGALERQKKTLTLRIGQFIHEVSKDRRAMERPDIRVVLARHRGILSKIHSLRKSIKYHRLLGGVEDDGI